MTHIVSRQCAPLLIARHEGRRTSNGNVKVTLVTRGDIRLDAENDRAAHVSFVVITFEIKQQEWAQRGAPGSLVIYLESRLRRSTPTAPQLPG